MKTIKKTLPIIIVLFIITLISLSCNKDENKDEETTSYIYEQQVYYTSAVVNKRGLLTRQEEIQDIIDAGNGTSVLLAEQDENSIKIVKLAGLISYLTALTPSVSANGAIEIPPNTCIDAINCTSTLNLIHIDAMVLHNDIEINQVSLFDNTVGDIVDIFIPGDEFIPGGDMFIPGDEFENQNVWKINKDKFTSNITKMYINILYNGDTSVQIETPIIIE